MCSGNAFPIRMILDKLISKSDLDIKVEVDPKKIRSAEVNVQRGDNTKIYSETGWKPQIPIDKTLEDILT